MQGRQSGSGLTRPVVVAAALALADEEGLDALTVRGVAARLHVTPMALYRHVGGKEALLDAVGDAVLAEVALPAPDDGDWRVALRETARSFRAALVAHPAAVQILVARPLLTPAAARLADALLRLLGRAGLSVADAAAIYPLLARFLLALVRAEAPAADATAEAEARAALEALAGVEHPHLAAAAPFLARPPAPARAFELGLDLAVGGIERLAGTSQRVGA